MISWFYYAIGFVQAVGSAGLWVSAIRGTFKPESLGLSIVALIAMFFSPPTALWFIVKGIKLQMKNKEKQTNGVKLDG